jgi:hypothetical protein
MHQMHNAHSRFGDSIEDEIFPYRKAAIAAAQVIPAAARFGIVP